MLPEFHRNGQEMTKCLDISKKSARKNRKMLEISGICEKIHFFLSFFRASLQKGSVEKTKRKEENYGLFKKKLENTATSGNNLGFPAIPTKFCENLDEKSKMMNINEINI